MARNDKKVVPCFHHFFCSLKEMRNSDYEKNKNISLPSARENTIGVNMMVKMQEHRLQ